MRYIHNLTVLFICIVLLFPCIVTASDLKDGISRYNEGPISRDDQLGDPEVNTDFIVLRAKSRAANVIKSEDGIITTLSELLGKGAGGDRTGNINSVVLGPGSRVNGDIIIIDSSSGDKTQIITSATSYASGLGLDLYLAGGELLNTSGLGDTLSGLQDQVTGSDLGSGLSGGLGGSGSGTIPIP